MTTPASDVIKPWIEETKLSRASESKAYIRVRYPLHADKSRYAETKNMIEKSQMPESDAAGVLAR